MELNTFLKKEFNDAIKHKGHLTLFAYGPYGVGKSTYSMIHSYTIYKDWDKVLANMIFTRQELIEKLRGCFTITDIDKLVRLLESGKVPDKSLIKHRIPCLIWDDATVGAMGVRSYDEFLEEFAKFYTVIRPVIGVFLWNGPSFNLLYGKLKTTDWVVARLVKQPNMKETTAYLYRYNQAPNGRIYVKRIKVGDMGVEETFKLGTIPDKIRKRYEAKRDTYPILRYLKLAEAQDKVKSRKLNEKMMMKRIRKVIKNMDNPRDNEMFPLPEKKTEDTEDSKT